MTDLRKLSEAATPGEWRLLFDSVQAAGSVDTCAGPVWGRIVTAEDLEEADAEGRYWSCGGSADANAAFIVALVNEFRSGSLIPRAEYERVLALLAEAREALNDAALMLEAAAEDMAAGRADEGGAIALRKQEDDARATLSRIDDALAAEREARG